MGSKQEFQKVELQNYIQELNKFARTQPDYKEGTLTSTQQIKFDSIYPRPFPTFSECRATQDASVKLAIIYFCQVLTSGEGQLNVAADNSKAFKEEHWPKVLSKWSGNNVDLEEKFSSLCAQLRIVRNEALGHAQADFFNIIHGDPITTMSFSSWQHIDIKYWHSCLENLRIAVLQYLKELNAL
jgi:isopenicillin N synthase-like dioxygenase